MLSSYSRAARGPTPFLRVDLGETCSNKNILDQKLARSEVRNYAQLCIEDRWVSQFQRSPTVPGVFEGGSRPPTSYKDGTTELSRTKMC